MAKKKIAILGGGLGALTTAYELTSVPGWKDAYEVTVHQLGWRLGGKGASGRNQQNHDRIEEHGLHIFFGFYDNAFTLMQRCYQELGRNPGAPLATWQEAFVPRDTYVLMQDWLGHKVPWEFDFPVNSGTPGQGGHFTAWELAQNILGWILKLFEKSRYAPAPTDITTERMAQDLHHLDAVVRKDEPSPGLGSWVRKAKSYVHDAVEEVALLGEGLATERLLHVANAYAKKLPADATRHTEHEHRMLSYVLKAFADWVHHELENLANVGLEIYRLLILMDIALAVVIGMLLDGLVVPPVDWFKIDALSFEQWLLKHGATSASANSPPVLVLKQLVFSPDGVGAGTCLHYTLELAVTYRGHFSYHMMAGMGDVIFGPLYEVLQRRGVKFEFFHRVDSIELSADKKTVERVRIGQQAALKGASYEALYEVQGLPCWPDEPLYDQLADGDKLRDSGANLEDWWTTWKDPLPELVLEQGKDFDEVVLGIAVGAFEYIAKELVNDAANPNFGRMARTVRTTQTKAAQLWFRPDLTGLGSWMAPNLILGTYYEPFDTASDMTDLVPRESWPPNTVGYVLYLTSYLPDTEALPPRSDHGYPHRQLARVRENTLTWLRSYIPDLFPWAVQTNEPTALNFDLLVGKGTGEQRFDQQFWIAVWNPSDRYVLSSPGTVGARLRGWQSGYSNLFLAGDWTLTALASGCAEATVMSGMECSRSICGFPKKISRDWLPQNYPPPPIVPTPPLPPSGLPRYVNLDGNEVPQQPYVAKGAHFYAWLVNADYKKLEALCDRYLNLPGSLTTYKPLGPFLFYVAANIDSMAPLSPQGWTAEKDYGFWVPVVAGTLHGEVYAMERILAFIPYLWVDTYLAQTAGREVFGYPKGVGVLSGPNTDADPALFTTEALVVPKYGAVGDPESQWQWKPLVRVEREGGGAIGELTALWDNLEALVVGLIAQLQTELKEHALPVPTLALLKALLDDVLGLKVPMVFNKQFRDVGDGSRACYQAIVESPNTIPHGSSITGGLLPGAWDITVQQYDSARILDALGIPNVNGVYRSGLHFWMLFDFTAETGSIVFQSGG